MHTLKVQLGLTLSILLFLCMLLFGMVLLTFWQRNIIDQERQSSSNLLHISAISLTTATTGAATLPAAIMDFIDESNISCLQYRITKDDTLHSYGNCHNGDLLTSLMKKAVARNSEQTTYSGMLWNGFFFTKKRLLMASPLQQSTATISQGGSIGLIHPLQKSAGIIHGVQKIFFAYLVINVLIFTTIGFTRLIHLVVRPIQRLALLADSRTDQGDSSFFPGERWGEFTQLSLSLNRLISRIDGDKQQLQSTVESLKKANEELQQNREEMIRTEKLAAVGRLAAGLAHEIGNPLGIIQGYVDLLSDATLGDDERKVFSERSAQELTRINALIRNLLDFSRSPVKSAVSRVNIHTILNDLIETIQIRKTASDIRYKTEFQAEQDEVLIDSDGLRQVLLNCFLNAIDAIEEKTDRNHGSISIHTENMETNSKECFIVINILDDGAGISEKNIDAVFDPFFTTKEVGKGTGLGLSVAHNLINKSGGHLTVSSVIHEGTTISITLPIAQQTH